MYKKIFNLNVQIYLFITIFSYLTISTNQQTVDSLEFISEPEINTYSDLSSENEQSNQRKYRRKHQYNENNFPVNDNSDDIDEDEEGPIEVNVDNNSEPERQKNKNRKYWKNNNIRHRYEDKSLTSKNVLSNTDEENSQIHMNIISNKNNHKLNRKKRDNNKYLENNQHFSRVKRNEYNSTEVSNENNERAKKKNNGLHKQRKRNCRCDKILRKELNKNKLHKNKQRKSNADISCEKKIKKVKRKNFCRRFCKGINDSKRNKTDELENRSGTTFTSKKNPPLGSGLTVDYRFMLPDERTTAKPKINTRTRRPTPPLFHQSNKKVNPETKESNVQTNGYGTNKKIIMSLRPHVNMNEGIDTVDGIIINRDNDDITFGLRGGNTNVQAQSKTSSTKNTPRQQIDTPYNRPYTLSQTRQVLTTLRPVSTTRDSGVYFPAQNNNIRTTTLKSIINPVPEFRSGGRNLNKLNTKECVRAILMCCKTLNDPVDTVCFHNLRCYGPFDGLELCSREAVLMARKNFLRN